MCQIPPSVNSNCSNCHSKMVATAHHSHFSPTTMATTASGSVFLLLLLAACAAVDGRVIGNRTSSTSLVSDGIHDHRNGLPYLLLRSFSAVSASDSCDHTENPDRNQTSTTRSPFRCRWWSSVRTAGSVLQVWHSKERGQLGHLPLRGPPHWALLASPWIWNRPV